MSTVSGKKASLTSRFSRRSNRGGSPLLTHDIYCINFYDNGLTAMRNEFINQIKVGLRRFLFVIDLDKEIQEANSANDESNLKGKAKLPELLPKDPVALTLLRIQDCLSEYNFVDKKIESEISFNLYKYWQKNTPAELKYRIKAKADVKQVGAKATGRKSKDTTDTLAKNKILCFGVTSREHNKVGRGELLSKRTYIKDQPMDPSIIIIIIGNMCNEYYKSLLAKGLPLRGIIHFLPEESAYDSLVPRPRRMKELQQTIENIQLEIRSLRKRSATKPIGIFQQKLPQMSICQASRFGNEIFDQLTYFIYDVHILREQYEEYYVNPFVEIDIKMKPGLNLQDTYEKIKSLSLSGHYLNSEVPAVHHDAATVYMYLESLLSTFGSPRELMTEEEVLLLANPTSQISTRILDKMKVYANAFKSIVKLRKREIVVVEWTNPLLTNTIAYINPIPLTNIYHACLEYNILRKYFASGYMLHGLRFEPFRNEVEPRHLPKFAKLYLTDDAVQQRIIQLMNEFSSYKIEEIHPNTKLYTFKKSMHEVTEHQQQFVIPTQLCFRDFTLYNMEEFLRDLVTPEMYDAGIEEKSDMMSKNPGSIISCNVSDHDKGFKCNDIDQYVVQPSIFIRPKSLKANRLAEQLKKETETDRTSKEGLRVSYKSVRSKKSMSMSSMLKPDNRLSRGLGQYSNIGLRPDHAMLTGYNLDDTLQTIRTKTSKYCYEEGQMTLYQEKWNFRQLNKFLTMEVDKQVIHFTNQHGDMNAISNNIRVETPRGIHLRIRPNTEECAKAVLNYPNGLSLYCHDTHAEHLWSTRQHEQNEKRRICTPHGCVIVFYNDNDTVLIMRYNGEVYRLYSCRDVMGEQEQEEMEETSDLIKPCSTQSAYSSYKPLDMSANRKRRCRSPFRRRTAGQSHRIESSSTSSQAQRLKEAKKKARNRKLNRAAALFASIDCQLKFLDRIMDLYSISYIHLKLTTSMGSVVHVEKGGKINCDKPIGVTEWHDYCANESYAMRNDGVRMIWTRDELRCYHADGTVINTKSVEAIDLGLAVDEVDRQISSSSSHGLITSPKGSLTLQSNNIVINQHAGYIETAEVENDLRSSSQEKIFVNKLDKSIELEDFEVEDQFPYDYSFVTYAPNNFLMRHTSYAGTQFIFSNLAEIETIVFANDNLKFRVCPFPKDLDVHRLNDELNENLVQEPPSSEADPDEWTHYDPPKSPTEQSSKLSTKVEVELPNLSLFLQGDAVELSATLRKFICKNTLVEYGDIQLKMSLKQNLTQVYSNWVEVFHKFINCKCPKWKSGYFIEYTCLDCHKKGLELLKSVPNLGHLNFCAGNYYLDPEELKNIHKSMITELDGYAKDMAKFPRFVKKKKTASSGDVPNILTAKIYVEIPAQLAYTDRIHLFLQPFDKIKFRRLRNRFYEAVTFHMYPNLQAQVTQEISKHSWVNRHRSNKRRMFTEQQRLSLYVAMLKHKVYPSFVEFRDNFYSHVRNIDFFAFMSSKCNEKVNPERYKDSLNEEQQAPKPEVQTTEQKKLRKKCKCPKYIKSLK